ncbi:MAG: hypothetical protein HY959_11365 [Ignavibacteriae bacterium]|nr:hypothetical protein [Ignavibacteriota bacterium]
MYHTGCNVKYFLLRLSIIFVLIFTAVFNISGNLNAQCSSGNIIKWSTWTLIQSVPSPVFFRDKNNYGSRHNFGFRWQITPVNISFSMNKLVSPVSILKVNPLKRHNGSMEILLEPQWAMEDFSYSDLKRFSLGTGMRIYFPLKEYGEYLSSSFAIKYNFQKKNTGTENNCSGIEAGLYSFFGIVGLKFNYNFNSPSEYNVSLNLKYY